MNMIKTIASVATVIAVISLGISYQAHSQIFEVSDNITKSFQVANSSNLTYVISEDGKCYDQYMKDGKLRCDVINALPNPPTAGVCLAPHTDPKAAFCK